MDRVVVRRNVALAQAKVHCQNYVNKKSEIGEPWPEPENPGRNPLAVIGIHVNMIRS